MDWFRLITFFVVLLVILTIAAIIFYTILYITFNVSYILGGLILLSLIGYFIYNFKK